MPLRPLRNRVLTLAEASDTLDARRALLADYCRLVGRRVAPGATDRAGVDGVDSGGGAAGGGGGPGRPRASAAGVDPALPPRLGQTLDALLAGDSEKQIARRLSISPHTVHTYVKQLHKRFGVSSRGELLARFIGR